MYNNPSGGAWAPGMAMPPLGFGVVAQQPTGNRMMAAGQQIPPQAQPVAAWQQQQYIAAQMGMASAAAVGVQPMPQQQQQGFHQYQQPQQLYPQQHYQQQQWIEAQKKVAEEQKKFYDQMMKQRQFDEQKMRLKAFSNSRKGGVSADSMIENILGPKDSQKPKSPPAPKKAPGSEGSKVAESSFAKQGTAVDWSKMNNIETLFTSTKEGLSLQPASHTPGVSTASENVAGDHGVDPSCLGVKLAFSSSGVASGHVGNTPPQQVKSSDHAVGVPNGPSGIGGNPMPSQKPHGKSIPLPSWLSDKASIPAVYRHACSLVEGKDGWVDTSRAYMLLMKTGLPPPFLGILWEMVNRTQPGQLLDQEFTTLLALVALVQSGQAITSPDVLSMTAEPVLPVIDHPALLPLVQDYIQHRQQIQQQQQQQHHQQPQPQQPLPQLPENSEKENVQEVNKEDDDEFEDFVSGPTPINAPGDFNSLAGSVNNQVNVMTSSQSLAVTTALTTPQLSSKPIPPPIEKMKKMNLPEVGFSPELSPSTSFDHALDDDFDDFQSAAMTNVSGSSSSVAPQTNQLLSSTSTEAPSSCNALSQDSFSNLNNCQDRYAVFRELELGGEDSAAGNTNSLPHDMGSNDDSFGDFCSSEPASLTLASSTFPPLMTNTAGSGTSNTTPVSFEVFSTPPEVPESSVDAQFEADFGVFNSAPSQQPCNYADIHEAMKRVEEDQKQKAQDNWADPFGEFEEAGRSIASTTQPIPQLNMDSAADDDFGDFMGPDGGLVEPDSLSFGQHFPKLSETLGETQSVASLELPGLEMTVGLQASESRGSGSGQSPDLFLQPRSEIGGVEEQLRGLTLDSSLVTSDTSSLNGGGISPNGNGSGGITQSTGSPAVLDSFTGGLMDKYSIIREEASKNSYDEAHTGSWQRCLEGSVKLLEHGHGILTKLMDKKLKSEVLATSQMQDYLFNLQEVWYVCDRISKSSQRVTTSIKVDQLLAQAKSLWEEILLDSESSLSKQVEMPGSENQMNEGEVCGVCLAGGGSKLTYGGHSYHPPCANLWLNCVDLLLPSLTPVTLL